MKTIIGISGRLHRCMLAAALSAAALLSVAGCGEGSSLEEDRPCHVTFAVGVVPAEGEEPGVESSESLLSTRSSIICGDSMVRCINLAFYSDGLLLCQQYCTDMDNIAVNLILGRKYHVYALANVEDVVFPDSESDVSGINVGWPGVESLSDDGLPMAFSGEFTASEDGSEEILLVRLVARYYLLVDRSGLSGDFSVTSLQLKNSASTVSPFAQQSTAAISDVCDGDRASDEDVELMNGGGKDAVLFYMFENCQGDAPELADNTDPWEKVPSNISVGNCATYIELTGDYSDDVLDRGDMVYRFFLGKDAVKNFDVVRNTSSTVTFCPTDGGIGRSSWKIDGGTPVYKHFLNVSPQSLDWNYDEYGSSEGQTIDVTANAAWTAVIEGGGSSHFSLETGSGEGNGTVCVYPAGQNGTDSSFEADLVFYMDGQSKASVTLCQSGGPEIPESITVKPGQVQLPTGSTQQFVATAHYLSSKADENVTSLCDWTSDDSSVVAVSSDGKASFVSVGSTYVRASYRGLEASAYVQAYLEEIAVELSPSSVELYVGQTQEFKVTAEYHDGTYAVLDNSLCSWTVSNGSTASAVDGIITGLGSGRTIISVESPDGNSASSVVKVVEPSAKLTVTPDNFTYEGGTASVTVTCPIEWRLICEDEVFWSGIKTGSGDSAFEIEIPSTDKSADVKFIIYAWCGASCTDTCTILRTGYSGVEYDVDETIDIYVESRVSSSWNSSLGVWNMTTYLYACADETVTTDITVTDNQGHTFVIASGDDYSEEMFFTEEQLVSKQLYVKPDIYGVSVSPSEHIFTSGVLKCRYRYNLPPQ